MFNLQVFSHVPTKEAGLPVRKKPTAVPLLFPDATPSTCSFEAKILPQCLQILPPFLNLHDDCLHIWSITTLKLAELAPRY